MSRDFTREIFSWLRAIRADVASGRLPDKALTLACAIQDRFNCRTRDCYPGQDLLAQEVGATQRTVRRLTEQLVERGHLVIAPTRSRLKTLRYMMPNRTPASGIEDPPNRTPASGIDEGKPDIGDQQTGHSWQSNRTSVTGKPDIGVRQTSFLTAERTSSGTERARARARTARRATTISLDWSPTDSDVQFALGEGLSDQECQRQAERFRDYWISTGKTKRDWSATWRNWIRREVDSRLTTKTGPPTHGRRSAFVEAALSTVDWNSD